MYIDTHCHLDGPEYKEDRDMVIQRANEAYVVQMITIGSTVQNSEAAVGVAGQYDSVFATVGVHPDETSSDHFLDVWPTQLEQLQQLVQAENVVGIGECGLDYHYDGYHVQHQEQCFRDQIELSLQYNLPLCIHARDASMDTFRILKDYSEVRFVMHSFMEPLDVVQLFVEELGAYCSFPGIATFKEHKIQDMIAVMRWMPKDRFFLETDSPYLAPVPYRGRRNEPAYVVETARAVAKYRGESLQDLASITTQNARNFFQLPHLLS